MRRRIPTSVNDKVEKLRGSVARTGLVVPTLGTRETWLAQCVDSIQGQVVPVELVVVGPDTEFLRNFCMSRNVQLVVESGRGLSEAINLGLSSLSPTVEYVSWLGDDDLLTPNSLKKTVAALDSRPLARFVYGRTRYIDDRGATLYRALAGPFAPIYMRYGQDYVPQPGSLVRRSALTWPRPLDETLKNAMDLDMFLKLAGLSPKNWVYIKSELSAYRIHDTAITQTKGIADESEMVRDRYRSRLVSTVCAFIAPIRRKAEKAYVWLQWRTRAGCVDETKGAKHDYLRPEA